MRAIPAVAAFFLLLGPLSGCVVWDIRDEMRKTNENVAGVQTSLEGTNERLSGTNVSLTAVEEQLLLLRSMNQSMGRLDEHLASLRKTIGALDSMMPFLDLGGAPVEEVAEAGAEAGSPDAAAPDAAAPVTPADAAAPPGSPAPTAPAPAPAARREVLAGMWVSAYPNSSRALIIMTDGTYVASTLDPKGDSKPPKVERGKWTKGTGTLTLQPDLIKIAAPAWPLLNPSARSFALQDGATVWVFTRP